MRFLSVCSGIEAASVAWEPLGWKAHAFAEIEPFPAAVLAHHYPGTPNLGDMTRFKDWPDADVSLLVGGTPCQSFSVAGLRKGLDDPRGNLALVYLAIADRYRPRWLVWENVPGVLSSNGGRDFGAFLGGMGQLGYGFAYRVLDAQYVRTRLFPWAVPQRRRRVFVVGYLGDWRHAAAVLFDRESLSGNPPPRREAGASVAALTANGVGTCGADDNQGQAGHLIAGFGANDTRGPIDAAACLTHHQGRYDFESETFIAHSLRGEGFDASEDGTGRGTPLVPVPFDTTQITSALNRSQPKAGDLCHPLAAGAHPPAIAFQERGREGGRSLEIGGEVAFALTAPSGGGRAQERNIAAGSAVRRLTPRECERLQGFPDDYTAVPYRGKPASDGPRYKALGNSMACNVMSWLGERIALVDALPHEAAA